jgi:hypothetical protein
MVFGIPVVWVGCGGEGAWKGVGKFELDFAKANSWDFSDFVLLNNK